MDRLGKISLALYSFVAVLGYLIAFTSLARAYELNEGTGMLCDTRAQMERFASLEAKPEAAQLINADAKKNVCVIVSVRYIRGGEVARVRSEKMAYAIVEILVVSVRTGGEWGSIPPEIQYTLFQVEEVGA